MIKVCKIYNNFRIIAFRLRQLSTGWTAMIYAMAYLTLQLCKDTPIIIKNKHINKFAY